MQAERNKVKISTKTLTKVAVLGAIAAILTLFSVPLWFAPSFYRLDFSEVAVLIGGFSMGPMAAVGVELVKILLNLLLNGTSTAGIGELANFIMGSSFVMTASLLYQRRKTMAGAITGLVAGTIVLCAVGTLMNYFVMLPVYAVAYHLPMENLIGMATALNPAIDDLWSFALLAVAPFNLFKGFLSSLACLLLYKRVSPILHK